MSSTPQKPTEKTPSLPLTLPNSMLLDAIRDASVRMLLVEEEALRLKRQELLPELFKAQSAVDAVFKELRPQLQKTRDQLNREVDELHREKNELHNALDKLRAEQDFITQAKDELRMLGYDMNLLDREIAEAEMLLRDEEREAARLRQLKVNEASNKLESVKKRSAKFQSTIARKQEEKAAKQIAIDAAREKVAALAVAHSNTTPETRTSAFQSLRSQIEAVQAKLVDAKRRKTEACNPEAASLGALRKDQDDVRSAIQEVATRLRDIRETQLPTVHFTYPVDLRMALIGPGGATLRQLQRDFGVALCVDGVDNGYGFAVGAPADTAACIAAIETILADAKCQGKTIIIPVEGRLKKEVIGPRGSTIDAIERESGARVSMADAGVTITGTEETVAEAQRLVEAVIDSCTIEELAVPEALLPSVIGKGGETINRVLKESGARSVRLDRERRVVSVTGTKTSVKAALDVYREMVAVLAATISVAIPCDRSMVARVIGPKGTTIRGIESASGARVNCENNTVTVSGTAEAVSIAKTLIADLKREEGRVEVDSRSIDLLMAPIVEVDEDEEKTRAHDDEGTNREQGEEAEMKGEEDASGEAGYSPNGSKGVVFITPLAAIVRATGCEHSAPLRGEGVVILRGKPHAVNEGVMLIKQFLMHNPPVSRSVACPEIVRRALIRRDENDNKNSTQLSRVAAAYSPLLHIAAERDTGKLVVSSVDSEEAMAAALELAGLVKTIKETHVRMIVDLPSRSIPLIIGSGGATIQHLQEDTGTEIVVLRDTQQVHIYHRGGDAEVLDEAVAAVKHVAGISEQEEDMEEVPGEETLVA